MKKQLFLIAGVVTACAASAYVNSSANMGDVQLKGYLGERLDKMIQHHIVEMDIDYITAPFLEKTERHGWWQTEFWGKYMHAAMPFEVYTGSQKLRENVERGLNRILSSQEPNGYIGNYPDELRCGEGWDVWGMKYTMMGLMHHYDVEKDEKSLTAAKRVCDYVISQIGPNGARGRELWETGNWSGYASSSILEPVMWLYQRTQDQKYLDFATFLVKGMTEAPKGPRLLDLALKGVSVADRNGYGGHQPEANGEYVMKHNRWKAYEMMSCYQGMLDYAEVMTNRQDLVKAALMTGEDIVKEEINLAGGCCCSEAWFHGARKQYLPYERLQETCVTTTWMRFCEKLLDVTGDTAWADQIEKSFYNVYLGSMTQDGKEFAAYTPLSGARGLGHHHCYMHTDCCTANGPRGFLCFLKKFFRTKGDAAIFNFYSSSLVKGLIPATGMKVAFDMYSLYPRENTARIVSHTEGKVPLKLRIPGWSENTIIKVNGQTQPNVKAGQYYTLDRTWQLGDVVEIAFDMPVIAHTLEKNVAFTRGPVLLARDSRFNDGDFMDPMRRFAFKEGQKVPTFAAVRSPSPEIWMAFSATLPLGTHSENPEGRNPRTVFFCDYASAGDQWIDGNYYRTWFPEERYVTE